jgi:hypothetical protein
MKTITFRDNSESVVGLVKQTLSDANIKFEVREPHCNNPSRTSTVGWSNLQIVTTDVTIEFTGYGGYYTDAALDLLNNGINKVNKMKTIYAKNSFNAYKELCLAEDTVVQAFESAGIQFTRDDNRFVSLHNELEVIILDVEEHHEGRLVLTQGCLSFAIENFFKQLWKVATKSFDKLLNVVVIDGEGGFEVEVGIDFCTDEDDSGRIYPSIDQIIMLSHASNDVESFIVNAIGAEFVSMNTDDFMELSEIEMEIK